MKSFAVRCLFRTRNLDFNTLENLYEERITVWRANNADDAMDRAIAEAHDYANKPGFSYLGLCQSFWMFTEIDADGVEVFSLLRESDLDADTYLDTFFSNGDERHRSNRRDEES